MPDVPVADATDVAALIDHTLLRADATRADVERACAEATQYGFASVCLNPVWVADAARLLGRTRVRVCTVIGFPLGATRTDVKCRELEGALDDGAHEADIVIHLGALKSGEWTVVREDLGALVRACQRRQAISKAIIETALLSEAEKVTACRLVTEAGADFVKTSTGFAAAGATTADVALLRRSVGGSMGVKASGGIRTWEQLRAMVAAGATRIGTSSGVSIVQDVASARQGGTGENLRGSRGIEA